MRLLGVGDEAGGGIREEEGMQEEGMQEEGMQEEGMEEGMQGARGYRLRRIGSFPRNYSRDVGCSVRV